MLKLCPVEVALVHLSKKWTAQIIGDLLKGRRYFNQILNANDGLTPKVLSIRLKKMEELGLIVKKNTNHSIHTTEYYLTKLGESLKHVLYQLALFSIDAFPKDLLTSIPNYEVREKIISRLREDLNIHS